VAPPLSEKEAGVARYKVIFHGLAVAGPEEEVRLLKGLQKKFNLSPEKAESLLQRVPIVVKKGASQEETEKYVRAFEEIGGKVKVEEEAFETLDISPEPPPERTRERISRGAMITCPQCGFEQAETDECVRCGVVISRFQQHQEAARPYEGKVREISSGAKPPPWEEGGGFLRAFFVTTRDLLFSPTWFYKKVAEAEGYWSPFMYGIITGIIGIGASILWQSFFFSQWFPVQRISAFSSSLYFIILTISLPIMATFFILIGSGVTHLCVMIVGGNKEGFQATFRSISYAFGAYLFGIIPFIGSTIGGIYSLVLTVIGVRECHGISTGKAVLAVLLPIIIVIGLVILTAILLPLFIGMVRLPFGVGV
jgi:hypothetical protein